VLEVVDGHRGDDGVEAPQRGQRPGEVVLGELDALVGAEALAGGREHGRGEVEADAEHAGAIGAQETEQAAVARAEVEDAPDIPRHVLEQDALPLGPARVGVRPAEIALDVLRGRPLPGGHAASMNRPPMSSGLTDGLDRKECL
jgi:hypothetical protein